MKKYYDANPPYITADADKVLCDGVIMTGLGGRISSKDTEYLDTVQEMTEEEALALVEENEEAIEEDTEDATEEDYIEALKEMGVELDEEE